MNGAIEVSDARPRGFFIVDNAIIRQHGKALGPYGISVYAALCMYADRGGRCTPSYLTVAAVLGISRRQVMREVDKIVELGLARADLRPDGRGKLHQTNVYTLLAVGAVGSDTQSPGSDTQSPGSDTQSLGVVTHSHPNKTHKNKTQEQDEDITAGAAPASTMTSIASAEAVHVIAEPAPTFTARTLAHLSASLGGTRVAKANGGALAWSGQIVAMLGGWTGDDADAAAGLWDDFRRSDKWRFKGANPAAWPTALGDWYANDRAAAPSKPAAPTDSRPPIGAVLSRLGLSESQPERWPPDVLARYPDIAAMWGYAPAGGAS